MHEVGQIHSETYMRWDKYRLEHAFAGTNTLWNIHALGQIHFETYMRWDKYTVKHTCGGINKRQKIRAVKHTYGGTKRSCDIRTVKSNTREKIHTADLISHILTDNVDITWGRYHGGRRPSIDDSFHSPTVIPPSALDKPSIMKRYHSRWTCSHTSPRRSPTMVTLHDTRFVECRWWNDGWTVKTVVTWLSSASMIPAPDQLHLPRSHDMFIQRICPARGSGWGISCRRMRYAQTQKDDRLVQKAMHQLRRLYSDPFSSHASLGRQLSSFSTRFISRVCTHQRRLTPSEARAGMSD